MNIECKEGSASLNFNCNLGHPDIPHIAGKQKKRKRKSKSSASRDNARAARHQSRQGAAISPAPGREAYVAPSLDQSDQLVSEEPTVPSVSSVMEIHTTPKRTATSPLESSPKRVELPVFTPSPPPDLRNGPINVLLPIWDSAQHSPEILREGTGDQDTSVVAELLLTERHHDEVEDGNGDEEDEDEGDDGNEDNGNSYQQADDCHCNCGDREYDCHCKSKNCDYCKVIRLFILLERYTKAIRELGASNYNFCGALCETIRCDCPDWRSERERLNKRPRTNTI